MNSLVYFIVYRMMGIKTRHISVMLCAYNNNLDYVGDVMTLAMLADRGIKPELAHPDHKTCSIGFSEKTQKWYGWSHRAICGFKIGDVVKEGDCCTSSGWTDEYLKEHPEANNSLPVGFKAETLEDCKKMAIAFAQSVS